MNIFCIHFVHVICIVICNHIWNDIVLVTFSNVILDIHVSLSSIMDAIWIKTCNEKMMSFFLLTCHRLLKCIRIIWPKFFYIGFEVISYDYGQPGWTVNWKWKLLWWLFPSNLAMVCNSLLISYNFGRLTVCHWSLIIKCNINLFEKK
jgi:hypothetical protein